MKDYTNSLISAVIDEYIHNAQHRSILKRRYIDHATYEQIAEEEKIDVSTAKRIVYKNEWAVFKHL